MSLQPLQPHLWDVVHFTDEGILGYFSSYLEILTLSSHLEILVSGACKISPDVSLVQLLHCTNEQSGDQKGAVPGVWRGRGR